MDIKEIKRIFDLYCQVECVDNVKITDLAKEMNVKKTYFMQFINDNPKHFNIFSYENPKKTSNVGLRLKNVYITIEDNPETPEYFNKMKEKYKKYIYINEWSNYGHIEGYYVKEDSDKTSLWRNTKEKIEELNKLGIFSTQTFYIGGWTDCSSHIVKNTISFKNIKKLEELGWTHNELSK